MPDAINGFSKTRVLPSISIDDGVCRHCSFVALAEVLDCLSSTERFDGPETAFWKPDGAKLAVEQRFWWPADAKLALELRFERPAGAKLALEQRFWWPADAELALERRLRLPGSWCRLARPEDPGGNFV